jgi:hypothetical protein
MNTQIYANFTASGNLKCKRKMNLAHQTTSKINDRLHVRRMIHWEISRRSSDPPTTAADGKKENDANLNGGSKLNSCHWCIPVKLLIKQGTIQEREQESQVNSQIWRQSSVQTTWERSTTEWNRTPHLIMYQTTELNQKVMHWIREPTLTRSQELEGDLDRDTAREMKQRRPLVLYSERSCLPTGCLQREGCNSPYIPLSTLPTVLDLPLPTLPPLEKQNVSRLVRNHDRWAGVSCILRQSALMPPMRPSDFH